MKIAVVLSALFLSANAFAALPPYWDSARKIQTVLESTAVANSLKTMAIKQIDVNGLVVIIESATCARFVTLEVLPSKPGIVGPANYSVASISDNPCN